jgi:hypothetical protein
MKVGTTGYGRLKASKEAAPVVPPHRTVLESAASSADHICSEVCRRARPTAKCGLPMCKATGFGNAFAMS